MDNKNLDLLEFLQYIIGCTYISDLRYGAFNDMAIDLFKHLDLKNWKEDQIIDAFNYIFIDKASNNI